MRKAWPATTCRRDDCGLANVLTALVALAHAGFLVLEMFFWDHPVGRKIFSMTPEVSASSAVLARNQGLYNGFLVAGACSGAWRPAGGT